MTIAVDVDLLRQHRLGLLAEADEIERRACLDPPDAGALTAVTAETLDHFSARADGLAEHLRELADAKPPVLDLPAYPSLDGADR